MAFKAPAFALQKAAQGVLVFSPSGGLLAQVTSKVVVWDVEQRAVVARFKAIPNEQHRVFAPDGADARWLHPCLVAVRGLIAIFVHEPRPRDLRFDEWRRYGQEHDLEFVQIHRASDGALLQRQPFDGACNARFRPGSTGLAVTSANVRGCYVEDAARLPVFSRVGEAAGR